MVIKRLLTIVLIGVLTTSYVFAIDYTVRGSVDNMEGKMLYMFDYDKDIIVDSTLVSNGQFIFKGNYERPAFVRIENGGLFSNCVLDTLAIMDFNTHFPSGGSSLNQQLIEFRSANQQILDELQKFRSELKSHGFEQPELGEIYNYLLNKLRPKSLQLCAQTIEANPNGVGEYAINQLSNLQPTPDEWDEVYSKMSPYLKDRRLTNYFNVMYTNLRNSQPGKHFIDFNAKTPDGKDVQLSDYVGKGKYVLIDFWASWCAPCKEEASKYLEPLYEKYKDDERFMILGVATWDDYNDTLNALDKLKYPWQQIVDAGEVPMKLYGFNGIPTLFLIGLDGTILARDLRGVTISQAVDSFLN